MASDLLETFELESRCLIKSSSRIFAKEYVEDGVPFFRSKDVIDKALGVFSGYDLFISRERYEELKKSHGSPSKGDLLISSVGNRSGQPYVVQDEGDFYFKDGNIIWISNFKDIDSNFLAYWFKSNIGQSRLASVMIGSAQKALTINSIRTLTVTFPIFANQKAIAHILGSLDDKIELNRQMNETLEAMAQTLFKSWFVDFDPVIDNALAAGNAIPDELLERAEQRKEIEKKDNSDIQSLFPAEFEFTEEMGWIPKGWELISFGEFCDIKKGRNITKSTVSEGYIPVVAGGLKPAYYHNESNVNAPVITVSASGANAGFVNLYYQDIWASDCSYISENMSPFIFTTYSFLKYHQDKVFGLQQGAVQPHVYPKDLSRLNFVDSDESVKIVIEKNLNSYYEKIKFNEAQTEALAKIRDTLLPKLMSGELRIPDDIF